MAVFAEMYWSPGINCQAEDRIHRMGQTSNEVKIIYILARETADDIVWQQTEKKSSTIGATIGKISFINNINFVFDLSFLFLYQ